MTNYATKKGVKRIRRSAWCCGENYQTWRFERRPYPMPVKNCPKCGKELVYRLITNPTLDRYYRQRAINFGSGLTSHGTKPMRFNANILTAKEKAWIKFRAEMAQEMRIDYGQ